MLVPPGDQDKFFVAFISEIGVLADANWVEPFPVVVLGPFDFRVYQ